MKRFNSLMNRFLIAAVLILLLLNLYQCSYNRSQELSSQTQLEALTDQVRYFKDRQGRTVAEKKLFSAPLSQLGKFQDVLTPNQSRLLSGARNVPNESLKAAVQVREVVEVPKMAARQIDSASYIYSDSLVSFTATLQDSTLYLDSLKLYNDKTILLLDDRNGTRLQVINSSPYFKSADIDGLLVPDRKNWYNSKAFKIIIFVSGGLTGFFFAR